MDNVLVSRSSGENECQAIGSLITKNQEFLSIHVAFDIPASTVAYRLPNITKKQGCHTIMVKELDENKFLATLDHSGRYIATSDVEAIGALVINNQPKLKLFITTDLQQKTITIN